jgi:hypothetical protein
MSFDNHANLATTTVVTAPTPPSSGTTLVVSDATVFPATPFNATVWPANSVPAKSNAEIVRVTNISVNTLTITRNQESTSARTILVGDQIMNGVSAKVFTDLESASNTNAANIATNTSNIATNTTSIGTINGEITTINTFINPLNGDISHFYEDKPTLSISGNTLTIDLGVANNASVTFNANITTTTINNIPASGKLATYTFFMTANGTPFTWAWMTSTVKWPAGIAPTFTSTNGKIDVFHVFTGDGGTNWYGVIVGQNY